MTSVEQDENGGAAWIQTLRRRVGWQVAAAYEEERGQAPAPVPAAAAGPAEPPSSSRRLPTLAELDRLVGAAADAHADRAEEWRWYATYLRDFVRPDGTLPESFGLLVDTVFGRLLQTEVGGDERTAGEEADDAAESEEGREGDADLPPAAAVTDEDRDRRDERRHERRRDRGGDASAQHGAQQ